MPEDTTDLAGRENRLRKVIEAQENARQEINWLIDILIVYGVAFVFHYVSITYAPRLPYTVIGPLLAFLAGLGMGFQGLLTRSREWLVAIALVVVTMVVGDWLMGSAVVLLVAAYIVGFLFCTATWH